MLCVVGVGWGGVGKGLISNCCALHAVVRVSGIRTGGAINAATCEVEQSCDLFVIKLPGKSNIRSRSGGGGGGGGGGGLLRNCPK